MPGIDLRLHGDFDAGSSLRRVGVVGGAASCWPVAAIVRSEAASAAAAEDARDVENGPVVAPEREVVGVAVRDRTGGIDRLRSHDAADDAQALTLGDGKPRREPGGDGEIGGVHHREQEAAVADETLQVRDAGPSKTRTHVVGLILRSEVRRLGRLFPRQRVAPHRHTVHDAFGAAADRRKDDDVELRVQVVVLRHLLRADVGERHLRVVEGLTPPAFGLRGQPGVEQRHARCADRMGLHGWRRARSHDLKTKIGRSLLYVRSAGVLDDERPTVELLPAGVERFLGGLEGRVLELVAQCGERDVGVVIHQEDRAGIDDGALRSDLAGDFFKRRVEHFRVGHAHRLHVVQLGEGPPCVVVRRALWIVRAPVLIVEQ